MNVQKLNEAMESLKEDLRGALVTTSIWMTKDGQSLVDFNLNPQAVALFNQVTIDMQSTLSESGFPELGKYYMLTLENGYTAALIPMGEYQWGIIVDETVQLGMFLNVILPRSTDRLEEAIVG